MKYRIRRVSPDAIGIVPFRDGSMNFRLRRVSPDAINLVPFGYGVDLLWGSPTVRLQQPHCPQVFDRFVERA